MRVSIITSNIVAAAFSMVALSAHAADLRVGIEDDPDILDPAECGTLVGQIVFSSLCDKLIDIGPDLQFVLQLATKWSWSPDQKTLTMDLREGVVFHDGTPFDGEAVVANIQRDKTLPESRRNAELSSVEGRGARRPSGRLHVFEA